MGFWCSSPKNNRRRLLESSYRCFPLNFSAESRAVQKGHSIQSEVAIRLTVNILIDINVEEQDWCAFGTTVVDEHSLHRELFMRANYKRVTFHFVLCNFNLCNFNRLQVQPILISSRTLRSLRTS